MSGAPAAERFARLVREFPSYDLSKLPPIPDDWADESWHNDACPTFTRTLRPDGTTAFVHVDFAEPADREHPEAPRFTLRSDHEFGGQSVTLYHGDDWDELLDAVRSAAEGCTWVVAYGSPCGGFKLHGPFPSRWVAEEWGEAMGEGGEWAMEVQPSALTDERLDLYPWSK